MKPRQPPDRQGGKVPIPDRCGREASSYEPPPRQPAEVFIMGASNLKCRECRAEYELEARYVCDRCFGPLEVAYDHGGLGADPTELRRRIQAGPQNIWRYADFLPLATQPGPSRARPRARPAGRLHAADPRRPPRRAPRPRRGLGQERRRQPDALVQGPRRLRRRRRARASSASTSLACASTGNLANSVAAHARRARHGVLRLHPGRPRGAEDPRDRRLRDEPRRGQRQLRRRQPALHRALRRARLGVRQRQHAPVLRRGLEDARLRDRRAARLGDARPRRRADRLGLAVHEDRQGLRRVARARADRRATCRR